LGKDNANRTQNKTDLSVFYAEVQLIFAFHGKVMQTERRTKQIYLFFMLRCRLSSHLQQSNANRTQNKTDLSVFYAEVPLIFAFAAK